MAITQPSQTDLLMGLDDQLQSLIDSGMDPHEIATHVDDYFTNLEDAEETTDEA